MSLRMANAVPTAANVTYHASIIEEKSILRQLVSVSTQIASMGYEANDDVKNIIDSAESKILEISNRKKTADFTPINEIVLDSFKSIEALMGNKNGLTGLPTGFEDLDNLTSGLHGSVLSSLRPVLPWVKLLLRSMWYRMWRFELPKRLAELRKQLLFSAWK